MSDESPEVLELDYVLGRLVYQVGDVLWTHHAEYVVIEFVLGERLRLQRKDVFDQQNRTSQEKHGS